MRKIWLLMLFVGFSTAALAQENTVAKCTNGIDDDGDGQIDCLDNSCATIVECNCSDGVDNDGNGRIDCFDGNCANKTACDESFIGNDKDCQIPPPPALNFEMVKRNDSENRAIMTSGRFVVGDIDGDGIPEVITVHGDDKTVKILRGTDLTTKRTINTTGNPERYDHAIGNIDIDMNPVTPDNCAEIFIAEKRSTQYWVVAYNACTGAKIQRLHGRQDMGKTSQGQTL
jgi:hypothetical protein